MYQPQSLVTIARKAINGTLGRWNYSWSLPIPEILKAELRNNFLFDNVENLDWKASTDCYRVLNWYTFQTPFVSVSPDIFLAIMQWRPEISNITFIPEVCLVTYIWYEEKTPYGRRFNPSPKRMCLSCKVDVPYETQMFKTWDTMSGYNVMDEVFQVSINWCSICHTSTLFKLLEYPYPGARRKFIEELCETDSDE